MALFSSSGGPFARQDATGRCPICGQRNAVCGGPTSHTPIDEAHEEAGVSGPLRIYQVKVAGREVLLRLNQADAQRLGGTPATGPEPETGPDRDAADLDAVKARQPPNKARTPSNKGQPGT